MKGSFLIVAKEKGIITEKGVRTFIMERLLNSPFSKGSVFNLDEMTVKVQLEGDERHIREFIENLQKALVGQFGNPTILLLPFNEDPLLEIPELMRSSQALMVGQLQKGISVQLDILDTLKDLKSNDEGTLGTLKDMKTGDENILNALKDLPQELARVLRRRR